MILSLSGMLSFRIISGHCKGRRIQAPKKLPVRPTTDRAKESLFNILTHQLDFEGARLLELYAGTGNISYEFTSRGGASSTAVDSNIQCISFIRNTADQLELPVTAILSEVSIFLSKVGVPYDLVFIDPPYALPKDACLLVIELVFKNQWIKEGLLVLEHPPQIRYNDHPLWIDTRTYGSSCFSFLKKIKKAGR